MPSVGEPRTEVVPNWQGIIDRYIKRGRKPGSGIHGALANDLYLFVTYADEEMIKDTREIVIYIQNNVPIDARGSHDAVELWAGQEQT